MPSQSKLICVGKIAAVHGIRGQVKIRSYTTIPENIADFTCLYDKTGLVSYQIKLTGQVSDTFIATIQGITDRNAAELLKGKELFVTRDMLPKTEEEEFYYEDLIGLDVVSTEGALLGKVKALHNFGAGDIIEIALNSHKNTEYYPFNSTVVPEINLEAGKIVLALPEEISGDK